MKVLPTIKGRKAIPVRAIPYVTGWKGPRGISPDMVARSLGQHPNDRRPFSAMQTLSAYSLHLGKPVEVRQASWRMVAVQLDGLSAQIEAQFPNDRKGKRNKQSLAAWHTRAIELLPKGVFVWLDEFEKEYLRYFDFQSHATLLEYPGERDLDLTLVAMTEKEWEVVMQGFDTQEVTWQDAPAVTKSASDQAEPGKAPLENRGGVMKREALIAKHIKQWPTIDRDLRDASSNGLSKAAKAPNYAQWFEVAALDWARQRGKLSEAGAQATPVNSVFNQRAQIHLIKG
jgi:hypothetical protein